MLDVPVDEEAEHDQDEKYLHEQQGVCLCFVVVSLLFIKKLHKCLTPCFVDILRKNYTIYFITLSMFLFCTTINMANSKIVQENHILLDI